MMHRPTFYARLAVQNLGKNRQFCLPYLLTAAGCAMMMYLMRYLAYSEMIVEMPGAAEVLLVLELGSVVVGITNFCLLWYANRFIMRRRQRELGLYHILGMEKRQVAVILALESLFLAVAGIALGLAAGVLFSKLTLLALMRLMRFAPAMGFDVCGRGMVETALLQGLFSLAMLAANWVTLARSRPVELLHAENVGEREPRSRWFLALLGVVLLGGGYAISILTKNPAAALLLFFVAVVLVILGTHCLFSAGSIVLLKMLRKNRHFYYQPRHFTAVSGLLYRMKQNARGLANICILSTMVLVTVSSTVCLYVGVDDSLAALFPEPIQLIAYLNADEARTFPVTELEAAVRETAVRHGCGPQQVQGYLQLSFTVKRDADGFRFYRGPNEEDAMGLDGRIDTLTILTLEDYNRLTGQQRTLNAGEVLACQLPYTGETLRVGQLELRVTDRLTEFPITCGTSTEALADYTYLVVADREALLQLDAEQRAVYTNSASYPTCEVTLRPSCGPDEMLQLHADCRQTALDFLQQLAASQGLPEDNYHLTARCRQASADDFYILYGGYFFLGLFLGLLFLLATALIVYYKQVSEGYEDRQRFEIMQKVGMSAVEVRAAIRSQVLLVFFLPLGMAALHIAVAFPMLTRMLSIFGLSNLGLFATCTGITLLVFCLGYILVYSLTAKKYYRIVHWA